MNSKVVTFILLIIACIHSQRASGETQIHTNLRHLSKEDKTVVLRTPPAHPQGFYLSALLSSAYNKLGFDVKFIKAPVTEELKLASNSQLSGVLARDIVIERKFPDLIKIEEPLFDFQVLLLGDRRVCGYCFPDYIQDVGFPSGLELFPVVIKEYMPQANKIALTKTPNVEEVLLKQRISAFVTSNIGLSEDVVQSPHIIKHVLQQRSDFHYLSPKYQHLKQPLERVLKEMKRSGEIANLKERYGIEDFNQLPLLGNERTSVKVTTGYWEAYTDKELDGVYWKLLMEALPKTLIVEKEPTAWLRAVRLFEAGKFDMLLGAYKGMPAGYLTSKYHIDYESEVRAYAHDEETLQRFVRHDKELKVCAAETYELVKKELAELFSVYQTDFFKCEQLFQNNRVDIIIDYPYNLVRYEDQYPSVEFHEALPLFVLFQNSERGRQLKQVFDKGMENAERSGRLAQHFLSYKDYLHAKMTVKPKRAKTTNE